MARKTTKICLVCGGNFDATAAGMTCKVACRVALKRIIDSGRKPDFYYIAKAKGQKLPELIKKPKVSVTDCNEQSKGITQNFTEPPKQTNVTVDIPKNLSKEQKLAKITELEKKINAINNEHCPLGQHPKSFKLNQEIRISEIQEEINKLKYNL